MSNSALRQVLRYKRQENRRRKLMREFIELRPEACRIWVIFGGDLEKIVARVEAGISASTTRAQRKINKRARDQIARIEFAQRAAMDNKRREEISKQKQEKNKLTGVLSAAKNLINRKGVA